MKKSERISIYVTPKERELLTKEAEHINMSVPKYLLYCAEIVRRVKLKAENRLK